MSEFAVEGSGLKKMVARARKQTVSFAFNPGQNAKEHMLGMDRRKAPELVGRSVRKSGPSMKIAFGTAIVEQRVFVLTCEKVLPAMAKKVKAALKANKVMLNVRILGPDGELLEEDIEDLPPDEDEGAPEDTAEQEADGETPAAPQESQAQPDRGELAARLQAARNRIAAAPENVRQKLQAHFDGLLAQVRDRDLAQALAGLTRLENALSSLPTGPAAAETGPDPAPADRLEQACNTLQQQIDALPNPAHRERLGGLLTDARTLVADGQAEKARGELRRIQTAMVRLSEVGAAQAEAPTRALRIWADAKDRTDAQITALQNTLKGSGHPLFEAIADKGLHGITEGELSTMIRVAMEFDNAQGEQVIKAAGALRDGIGRMRGFLNDNRAVGLLDENEMGVAMTLRQTLGAALQQIEAVMVERLKAVRS